MRFETTFERAVGVMRREEEQEEEEEDCTRDDDESRLVRGVAQFRCTFAFFLLSTTTKATTAAITSMKTASARL